MWKCHLYVYLICCLYCYQKHVFMKSDGICNSFINPTPYLEMDYFLPLYTENAACIYGLIFSSPEPLGSQSELIVYPSSGRPSVVRPSVVNNFKHLLRNCWANQSQIYVEPPWVGGTIFCLRHLGHMTKMAATPIYGKNPSKIFFSRTGGPIFTKLVCSIGDSSPS